MNPSEREELHRCFSKTKKLFKRKRGSESWADNLIEGTKGLKTPLQWKHMYTWLANPRGYNEAETDSLPIDNSTGHIKPYPSHMKVETFQNGAETIVRVINTRDKDVDEKQDV